MSFSHTIILASESEIKINAVGEWLLKNDLDCCIEPQTPGPTMCKQPIGKDQALKCIKQRVAPLLQKDGRDVIVVAVENYLHKKICSVADYALVKIYICSGEQQYKLTCRSDLGIVVPPEFDPTGLLDGNGLCQTTVGDLWRAKDSTVPANDWHGLVSSVGRTEQIIEALDMLTDSFRMILRQIEATKQQEEQGRILSQQAKTSTD